MRSILLAAAAAVSGSPASAHDFWLEPEKFRATANDPVDIRFTIGHAGEHEPWNLQLEKVAALKDCLASECSSVDDIVPNTPGRRGRARVALKAAGTHILAFESRHSFSELAAPAFNEYAKKEGLSAILEDRAANAAENEPGRELYSRRAKTLIEAGAGPGDVSAAVGHTLEIIPLKDPYALRAGEALPFRVLFKGAPLSGATIDFDDLSDKLEPLQTAITDTNGAASFTIGGGGPFKLMTIWGVPLADRGRADYETFFASLTFGR